MLSDTTGLVQNILEASTQVSIIGKDADRRIVLWNEGARRIYGYEPSEILGIVDFRYLTDALTPRLISEHLSWHRRYSAATPWGLP